MSEATEPAKRSISRSPRFRLALLTGIVITGVLIVLWGMFAPPKRFAAVAPDRLYRSGKVTPAQLERLKQEVKLRTVLSLLAAEAPETIAEREAAERLGLVWLNVPLPGNGASTPEDRERIKSILFDPQNAPMLVHCAAGTNRTGLAVGMYRLYEQGWTLERVMEEMLRFDFENEPHHQNLRDALAESAGRG